MAQGARYKILKIRHKDQGSRIRGVEGSSEKHIATSYPDLSGYSLVFSFKIKMDSRSPTSRGQASWE